MDVLFCYNQVLEERNLKKKYLLFDLDGTIIEPSQGIYQSVNYAMSKLGRERLLEETLRTFIGPPLEDSFMGLGMNISEAQEAISYYREYYREKGILQLNAYPGIKTVLQELAKKSQLYLATSKPEPFAEHILEHLEYTQYFTGIYGANLSGTRSKKADVIKRVFEQSKIADYDQVVMIGDRKHDIIGAKENGIDSIGVLYGFGSELELKEAGATELVESVQDLLSLLS
ncbi:HAD family hydrolase [Enterococcus sp. LJL98]